MEFRIVSSAGARRLILIYAGWAMDWHPFSNLRRSGYDIAVVWDYNDISLNRYGWNLTPKCALSPGRWAWLLHRLPLIS